MLHAGLVLKDRYHVVSILGQGGMGAVYLAEDATLGGKRVAIKDMVVTGPREKAMELFREEAGLLASLDHPGLVEVTDYFEHEGRVCMVMSYVDGMTLEAASTVLPDLPGVARVVGWLRQICGVMKYLHGRTPPVVFRDLKPGNVMLDAHGRIRLIDFGIARVLLPSSDTRTFLKGAGSPGFSPPEQYGGTTEPRSDIYALGATAYYLLTREVPPISVTLLTGESRLRSPQELNPCVDPMLAAIVLRMMAPRKEDRYPSIEEVEYALSLVSAQLDLFVAQHGAVSASAPFAAPAPPFPAPAPAVPAASFAAPGSAAPAAAFPAPGPAVPAAPLAAPGPALPPTMLGPHCTPRADSFAQMKELAASAPGFLRRLRVRVAPFPEVPPQAIPLAVMSVGFLLVAFSCVGLINPGYRSAFHLAGLLGGACLALGWLVFVRRHAALLPDRPSARRVIPAILLLASCIHLGTLAWGGWQARAIRLHEAEQARLAEVQRQEQSAEAERKRTLQEQKERQELAEREKTAQEAAAARSEARRKAEEARLNKHRQTIQETRRRMLEVLALLEKCTSLTQTCIETGGHCNTQGLQSIISDLRQAFPDDAQLLTLGLDRDCRTYADWAMRSLDRCLDEVSIAQAFDSDYSAELRRVHFSAAQDRLGTALANLEEAKRRCTAIQ